MPSAVEALRARRNHQPAGASSPTPTLAAETFSLTALVRQQLGQRDPDLRVKADEGQAEASLCRRLADAQQGFGLALPAFALAPRPRAIDTGSGPSGGFLVSERLTVAELLEGETTAGRLGVQFLNYGRGRGEMKTVALPATAQSFWVPEGVGPAANSDVSIDAVTSMGWHDAAAKITITRRLMKQAPGVETQLRSLLRAGLAELVDAALFTGSGGIEPVGLVNDADVPSSALSGSLVSWAEASEIVAGLIADRSTDLPRLRWCVSAADYEGLMAAEGRTATDPLITVSPDGTHRLGSVAVEFSSAIPAGTAICGDWRWAVIGAYGLPELRVNPYLSEVDFSLFRLTLHQSVGLAAIRPDRFVVARAA